jgi:hypothetical protein
MTVWFDTYNPFDSIVTHAHATSRTGCRHVPDVWQGPDATMDGCKDLAPCSVECRVGWLLGVLGIDIHIDWTWGRSST